METIVNNPTFAYAFFSFALVGYFARMHRGRSFVFHGLMAVAFTPFLWGLVVLILPVSIRGEGYRIRRHLERTR